jgi:hypothetical protein
MQSSGLMRKSKTLDLNYKIIILDPEFFLITKMKHNERKSKYGLYIRLILHTNCFDHRFDSHERIMAAKWHGEKSCWCQDIEDAKLKVCSQINEYPPPCESARHFTISLVLFV